jgi:hypothetical protein
VESGRLNHYESTPSGRDQGGDVKKFVNEEMAAPNVLRVPIDVGVAQQLAAISKSRLELLKLYSTSSAWRSDIRSYSPRFKRDFHRFRAVFDSLGVAQHVEPYLDLADRVRLYNSFLVIRSRCMEPNFHVDWIDTNNEGFTLLTPLTDNSGGFGLLYKKLDGTIGEYDYRLGEALIFGDDFTHTTKPGVSKEPVVLLCFNFGTDKMEHWPSIFRTAGRQTVLVRRPDGKFQWRPLHKRFRGAVGSMLRKMGLRRNQSRSVY